MAIGKFSQEVASSTICTQTGARIRELRTVKGWTQQILADHAQIERAHLARLEEGRREAGLMMLKKISNALGVSLSELLKGL
jgi:transcriptional regulator with XRE-family HTH domain